MWRFGARGANAMADGMNMLGRSNVPYSYKLRVADFERLDRAGVFDDLYKVELIEGEIVAVNAEMIRHNRVKFEVAFRLRLASDVLDAGLYATNEAALALSGHSLPEPDVLVAQLADSDDQRYFDIRDARIVVEVADTTLQQDLGRKRVLYGQHLVPEYWVVDIAGGRVHQFWSPAEQGFAASRIVPLAGELRSLTIPDLAIDGTGIL